MTRIASVRKAVGLLARTAAQQGGKAQALSGIELKEAACVRAGSRSFVSRSHQFPQGASALRLLSGCSTTAPSFASRSYASASDESLYWSREVSYPAPEALVGEVAPEFKTMAVKDGEFKEVGVEGGRVPSFTSAGLPAWLLAAKPFAISSRMFVRVSSLLLAALLYGGFVSIAHSHAVLLSCAVAYASVDTIGWLPRRWR